MNDIALRDLPGLPTNYDPKRGLKHLAVAEAAERHFKRAKDSTGLHEAVQAKLGEQRRFVLWWDEQEKNPGGNPSQTPDGLLPSKIETAEDYGLDRDTIYRWRKRLKEPKKFDSALKAAHAHCVKVCEARQGYSDLARATFSGDNEWFTPAEYIEAARQVLGGIDLDPASNDSAQELVKAERYFTKTDNGLVREWHGRVWLNPPYAQPLIMDFVSKLVAERRAGRVTGAVMLTNNSADTTWFHEAAETADAFCLTRGRIKFYKTGGETSAPTQGQAFFYFGDDAKEFTRRFREIGLVAVPA